MEEKRYPRLLCDLPLLRQNIEAVVGRCHHKGISVAGVVKGANALLPISEQFVRGGCDQLAASRLRQLEQLRSFGLPLMLIRIPMLSEVSEVVRICDISLESEQVVIDAINEDCIRQGRRHAVVLMADLGDLREGWWDSRELIETAIHTESLSHVHLAGIGTNLGCYGSVLATEDKMNALACLAEDVERAIGRPLEIISGGSTSSYPLVHRGTMPAKISHLRIGEGVLLSYDYVHEWKITDMPYLSDHVFTLQAEVLECRFKPTYPVGELFIDAFGRHPVYEDRGNQRRALLGIGKLDLGTALRLIPRDSEVRIIGGSSDHLIVECGHPLSPGDVLSFDISYSELVFLTSSPDVTVEYLTGDF